MIKSSYKLFTAAVLLSGTIGFGACSSTSTNTVSTGNTNAASVVNTADTNKMNSNMPKTSNTKPENTTADARPPMKKEEMLSADTAKVENAEEKIGVPECDEYIAKYEACITSKAPADQRDALIVSMEEMRKGWKNAATNPKAKAALAGGCKVALNTAKTSMAAFSCDW